MGPTSLALRWFCSRGAAVSGGVATKDETPAGQGEGLEEDMHATRSMP